MNHAESQQSLFETTRHDHHLHASERAPKEGWKLLSFSWLATHYLKPTKDELFARLQAQKEASVLEARKCSSFPFESHTHMKYQTPQFHDAASGSTSRSQC
jgi:hypothetical protein